MPLYRVCLVLCALAVAGIFFFSALPLALEGHRYRLRCVRPRFTAPCEQYALAAAAEKRGERIFGALYDAQQNVQIEAYVPSRGSFSLLALSALYPGRRIAMLDDFLPAPPAPMAFEFIDESRATPLRVADADARRKQGMWIAAGLALLSGYSAWRTRSRGRT